MRGKLFAACAFLMITILVLAGTAGIAEVASAPPAGPVTLEVLNPRGEVVPPPVVGISPRVADLAGKKIGLYDNGKAGFTAFLDEIEKLLKQKYPTSTILRYRGAGDLGDALAKKMAAEVDTFIYGSCD